MIPNPPLDAAQDVILEYFNSLNEDDEVIDCGSSAMYMTRGVVYIKDGIRCVMWTLGDNWGESSGSKMGTSITWGTRKVSDVKL